MKRSFYREADYVFGQAMLTLRTSIGLTQAGLERGVKRFRWVMLADNAPMRHLVQELGPAVRRKAIGSEITVEVPLEPERRST